MGPLDHAGTVFGVGESDSGMPDTARRYARALALHHRNTVLPAGQHDRLPETPGTTHDPSDQSGTG